VNVHWTSTARSHLTAIHDYIAQNSPRYAKRMVDRITRRSEHLALFPLSGAVVEKYADQSIREVLENPTASFTRSFRIGLTSSLWFMAQGNCQGIWANNPLASERRNP
jgi:plasmid stabilization system protein ParE